MDQKKVLLLTHSSEFHDELQGLLRDNDFRILIPDTLSAVLPLLKKEMPHLFIVDYNLDEDEGLDWVRKVRCTPSIKYIPILILLPRKATTQIEQCFLQGADDYIPTPIQPHETKARINCLTFYGVHKKELASQEFLVHNRVRVLIQESASINRALVNVINHMSENLDRFGYKHLGYFSEVCVQLALILGASQGFAHKLRLYAPVYDIGKILVPPNIMNKTGKLTQQEFDIIKTHVMTGPSVFQDYKIPPMLRNIIEFHHEKWDGSGYNKGLKGNEIPLEAQIVSLMDVYNALVSDKVYKNGFTHAEAVQIINDSVGMQFNPLLVKAFMRIETSVEKYLS